MQQCLACGSGSEAALLRIYYKCWGLYPSHGHRVEGVVTQDSMKIGKKHVNPPAQAKIANHFRPFGWNEKKPRNCQEDDREASLSLAPGHFCCYQICMSEPFTGCRPQKSILQVRLPCKENHFQEAQGCGSTQRYRYTSRRQSTLGSLLQNPQCLVFCPDGTGILGWGSPARSPNFRTYPVVHVRWLVCMIVTPSNPRCDTSRVSCSPSKLFDFRRPFFVLNAFKKKEA